MLADRTFQPRNVPSTRAHWHTDDEINGETMKLEECMLFVINEDGATKIIKKRHWGKFIRRHQRDDENKEGVADMESGRHIHLYTRGEALHLKRDEH